MATKTLPEQTDSFTLEEIRRKYKDEWILLEVIRCDEQGQPKEGRIIAHSKNRGDTYAAMTKIKSRDIAHFYTGKIPKEGYAVAFYGKNRI